MNKKNTHSLFICLFLSASLLFQLGSCKKGETAPETKELDSVITFISGEATIISENSSRQADIGSRPRSGDVIRTAADSYLELLVDSNAVIRMDSSTELSLDRLLSSGEEAEMGFSLLAGTVISKVGKLTAKEGFSIKTSSAAFGVRGTEFLVSSVPSGGDILAVKSGSIQLVPYPDLVGKLKSEAGENEALASYIKIIEEDFPLVASGSEISLLPGQLDDISASLSEALAAAENKKSGKITSENLSGTVMRLSAAALDEALKVSSLVKPVSAENLDKLGATDSMNIHSVDDILKEIILKTDPAGAEIYLNGVLAGYGSLSALMAEERIIKITVTHEGYVPFEKEIAVSGITEKPYLIKLEKREPEKGYVEVSVSPPDAEIYIGSEGPFKGTYRNGFDPGSRIKISVRKKEYREQNLEIEVSKGITEKRKVSLELLLVPYSYDTGLESADLIVPAGKGYFAFTKEGGLLSVVSSEGKSVFRSAEAVKEEPVFLDGMIAYVSGNALKALDAQGWKESGSLELEETAYGKPLASGGSLYINSGDSVLQVSGKQLAVARKIKVPDRIVSNPVLYDGKLLTVTDKGVLQIFGDGDTPLSSVPVSMGNPEGMSGAVSGDTGYFAATGGSLVSVDLKSGKFLWSGSFTKSGPGTLPAVIASSDVVSVLSGGTLKFFTPSGATAGEVAGISSFCGGEGQLVYASTLSGRITAYNPSTGAAVKQADTGLPLQSIVFRDGKIHAADGNGRYAVINPGAFKK